MGYPALLWLSTGAALLGSVQFGYHIGVLNTCEAYVEADLHFSSHLSAAVVAALLVGATLGSLVAGRLADRLGPRTAAILNNSVLLAGAATSTTAGGLGAMLAGRGLAGVGAGAASVLVPRYLAEVAPTAIRGALGTLTQVFVNVGIVAAYVIGFPYEGGAVYVDLLGRQVAWWRIMFAAALGPALLQCAALALCPESPIWLLRSGRAAAAAAALRRLHGAHFRPQDYPKLAAGAEAALAASRGAPGVTTITATADAEQPLLAAEHGSSAEDAGAALRQGEGQDGSQLGWSALWQPRFRRVMVLAAAMPLLQQASGINTVIFFSTEVFQRAGLKSPILGSIAMGLTNLGFTVVAALLMDRAGRRKLLLTSYSGMAACLAALSAFMLLPTPRSLAGAVALSCILLYMVFFALGAGPIPWLYLPEILPQELMGTAQPFCTALNWASNLVVSATFPSMLGLLGIAGSYLVYAALNAGAAAFMARRMVETKQQPLERIRALLLGEGGQ